MSTFTALFESTIRMMTPFLLVSTGLVVSERSGLMQVNSECLIVLGAFASFWGFNLFNGSYALAILFAVIITMIFNLIYAVTTITLPCRQVVVGAAMNMLIPGLCTFLYRKLYVVNATEMLVRFDIMKTLPIPGLSSIPIIGKALFDQTIFTYVGYIMVIVVWLMLYRTSLGMKIIAVGEHPRAAESTGVNVSKIRYLTAMFSAAMCGFAGAGLMLSQSGAYVEDMAGGRGFIALAIVVLARWNPIGALLGSLLFGLTNAVQIMLQAMGVGIPSNVILMLPYVSTLLVVIILSKNKVARPSAMGVPYRSGQ